MPMRFLLYFLPCLIAAPVLAQPAPNVAPAKRALQIDPKAVELLDKTAKYYGSLHSLKIVTRGVAT